MICFLWAMFKILLLGMLGAGVLLVIITILPQKWWDRFVRWADRW